MLDPDSKDPARRFKTEVIEGGKALWDTPLHRVTMEVIDQHFAALYYNSPSMLMKVLVYARPAYDHAALSETRNLRRGDENPFTVWRKTKKPKPPAPATDAIDLNSTAGKKWLITCHDLRSSTIGDFYMKVMADYFLLMLLWGTRKTETARLLNCDVRWVDGLLFIRPDETKNHKPHAIPLTRWASHILRQRLDANRQHLGQAADNDDETVQGVALGQEAQRHKHTARCQFIFPGSPAQKIRPSPIDKHYLTEHRPALDIFNAASGLDITAHDLRRTFASGFRRCGAAPAEVSQAMNHSKETGSITNRYIDVRDRAHALRPHYEVWEATVQAAVGLTPTAVDELGEEEKRAYELLMKSPKLRAAVRAGVAS